VLPAFSFSCETWLPRDGRQARRRREACASLRPRWTAFGSCEPTEAPVSNALPRRR